MKTFSKRAFARVSVDLNKYTPKRGFGGNENLACDSLICDTLSIKDIEMFEKPQTQTKRRLETRAEA